MPSSENQVSSTSSDTELPSSNNVRVFGQRFNFYRIAELILLILVVVISIHANIHIGQKTTAFFTAGFVTALIQIAYFFVHRHIAKRQSKGFHIRILSLHVTLEYCIISFVHIVFLLLGVGLTGLIPVPQSHLDKVHRIFWPNPPEEGFLSVFADEPADDALWQAFLIHQLITIVGSELFYRGSLYDVLFDPQPMPKNPLLPLDWRAGFAVAALEALTQLHCPWTIPLRFGLSFIYTSAASRCSVILSIFLRLFSEAAVPCFYLYKCITAGLCP